MSAVLASVTAAERWYAKTFAEKECADEFDGDGVDLRVKVEQVIGIQVQ